MRTDKPPMMDICRIVRSGWVAGRRCSKPVLAMLISLLGLWHLGQAADFSCAAGDVACLIAAINQANASGEANTITLEAGTYTLTAVDNTTMQANGLPVVTSPLTITGAGAESTIIERAATAPFFRLMQVAAAGSLTLEGLTLRGGQAEDQGAGGGGILTSGTLTLIHTTLAGNAAGAPNPGGGISSGGAVTIVHSTFTRNGGDAGGGIFSGGPLTVLQSTFAGNGSDQGGAISNGGTLTLANSAIIGNFGHAGEGGGLANFGTAAIINSTVARNTAGTGGGISNDGGVIMLTNVTLADNENPTGPVGGIANIGTGGAVVLLNTILARNINSGGLPGDCSGPVTSLGNNLIGNPTGCAMTLLPSDLTGDPGLGDFTDDGTPGNGHFPLLSGSPAIDTGNDAFCTAADQLGQPRVGRCDIGAIEFQRIDP